MKGDARAMPKRGAVMAPAEDDHRKWAAAPQPDVEVRAILRVLNRAKQPAQLEKLSITSARRELRMAAEMSGTREEVGRVRDMTIAAAEGAIPIRIYEPAGATSPLPVLVWFHGGGFILGCLEMADGTCRAIANRSGAAVISVDYRLAPEHDMSAGRRDCIAAVQWVREHATRLGLDPDRIAVGGDSAGGNLAAVVAQHCAKQGPRLALQVLVYPATDLRVDYKNDPLANGYMLNHDVMEWLKAKIPDDLTADDPWLSPVLAKNLKDVAPALVVTAGCDPLHSDGQAYIERLRQDGIRVESLHYPGQIHGFMTFDLLFHAGRDALQRVGESLRSAFSSDGAVGGTFPARTERRRPSAVGRRRLTELHFDQMVLGQFLLETHRALMGHLALALTGRHPSGSDPITPPTPFAWQWPQRFRPGIGETR